MTEEIKLDRKRSYGTVYGDPNVGFVQDERHFRHDGSVYEPIKPEVKAEPEPPKRDVLTRNGVVSK